MNITLYTVITGDYDILKPTRWPGICFTDGTVNPAAGWTLSTSWDFEGNPMKDSRKPKILVHKYLPEAEYSLYIDGDIELLRSPEELAAEVLRSNDIAVFRHPQRNCLYDEAAACVRLGKPVNKGEIDQQMEKYRVEGFPIKFGLAACTILLRRHTDAVAHFCELWWQELAHCGGYWSDQLCFDYIRWKLGISYDIIPGDVLRNKNSYVTRGKHK